MPGFGVTILLMWSFQRYCHLSSLEATGVCFIVRDGKAAKIWCKQRHIEYVIAAIG
jgi:hypothetical protein